MPAEPARSAIAVFSAERRLRTALRALLQTGQGYRVSVAATPEQARTLLSSAVPAAVVVGLGPSPTSTDAALLHIAEQEHPSPAVVVGSRGGHDLDTGPDPILAAVAYAVGAATAADRG